MARDRIEKESMSIYITDQNQAQTVHFINTMTMTRATVSNLQLEKIFRMKNKNKHKMLKI